MTISVLDPFSSATLDSVDDELLPCRSHDAELRFAESPAGVELAKALCLDCPVRAECLAGALGGASPGASGDRGTGVDADWLTIRSASEASGRVWHWGHTLPDPCPPVPR